MEVPKRYGNIVSCHGKDGKEIDERMLEKYKCVVCSSFLHYPYQLICGDRACKICTQNRDSAYSTFFCKCGQKISANEHKQSFFDKSCMQEMSAININCRCGWCGTLDCYRDHLGTCKEAVDTATRRYRTATDGELPKETEKKDIVLILKDKVEELTGIVEKQRQKIDKIQETAASCSESIRQLNLRLDDINLKMEIIEVKSTTGVYVWKVNEVARRARDARTDKVISLYSPPFYTSVHGYRMCLRTYLYGDGTGKGTHISVFLVIMRSEYDDLLSWPFKHRVIITLVNLDNPLKPDASITHKFLPSPKSSSFDKPKEAFNLASGFPQFASLNVLSDPKFVKNDTLYFRVKLEPPDSSTKTSVDDL